MNERIINKIILYLRRYCPTMQDVTDPTVMAVIETPYNGYYIFAYDPYAMNMDVVIYDNDDGYCRRDILDLSEFYNYIPKMIEDDDSVGLKLSQLYSVLGKACTYGDWNNTRNVENVQQMHMAMKLFVSYEQSTLEPICQAHVRCIDKTRDYYIYGYDHTEYICTCLEVTHAYQHIMNQHMIDIKNLLGNKYGVEIVGHSKAIGKTIRRIKEEYSSEL